MIIPYKAGSDWVRTPRLRVRRNRRISSAVERNAPCAKSTFGRVAFELMGGRADEYGLQQSAQRFYYGGQYENSITNLFGYFFSYYLRHDHLSSPCYLCRYGQKPLVEQVGQFGVYFELPRIHDIPLHNLTLQVGHTTFNTAPFGTISNVQSAEGAGP